MIKRLFNLFKQDLMVAIRNYFHYVIIIMAVLMIVIVNFVIPAEVKLTPSEIFLDKTDDQKIEGYLINVEEMDPGRFVDSEEELYERLESDSNTLGVILEGSIEDAHFTLIGQGGESEASYNLLEAAMVSILDHYKGTTDRTPHRVEYLRPQTKNIPFNKQMIPILMFTEVILLGFLLIAVMVFQEKEEGGVRAYRVSPGGTLEYILAKAGSNLFLAVLYAILVIVFTMGFDVNFLPLFGVIVLANILMTFIGLSISVFFKSLEEFIFVAILFMSVLALPMVSYLNPAFAPKFMTYLPSYPVLFGLREILFPTGKTGFITSLNWMLLAESLVLLGISYWAVQTKLMKEGK